MFDFNEATAKNKEVVDTLVKNFTAVSNNLQSIATEASDFSKKTMEEGVAHFEKLIAVKSIEASIELQTSYAKSAYEAFVAQATKMTDMYADLAKGAFATAEAPVAAPAKAAPAKAAKAAAAAAEVAA